MKIKLVIWDLDDTLWSGTLAEQDEVRVFAWRVGFIRALNERGIVSSICSKNDPDMAQQQLTALGLWDDFVFPRISFAPKGPAVKQLIADMQLRPENVLFIDDNIHNLQEVQYLLPEVHILDATTTQCDQSLQLLVDQNEGVRKNRIGDYRMLEARLRDNQASDMPQEEFLRSCDIRIALVHRMDNLDFAPRIEELVNRSNQLNFTQSRVEPGVISDLTSDILRYNCFSVFVWDNYGYHGLVGFAAVERERRITHFVFSCRVMHMGIENWVLAELKRLYPHLDLSGVPVQAAAVNWIGKESFHDEAVRARIYNQEFAQAEAPRLRIMANCQSGAIAHFSGLAGETMFDNSPQAFDPANIIDRVFYLRFFLSEEYRNQHYPQMLVYGAFVDYANGYWPGIDGSDLESSVYLQCVQRFCEFVQDSGRSVLVIIPIEDAPEHKIPRHFGVTPERLAYFNAIWRHFAEQYSAVQILDLSIFATEEEVLDVRHYSVELLKKIAECTRAWYDYEMDTQALAA